MEIHRSLASEVFMYKGSLQYGPLIHFVIYTNQYTREEMKEAYYHKIKHIKTVE